VINNTVVNKCKLLLFGSNWFIFDIWTARVLVILLLLHRFYTFVCRIKVFKKITFFFIVKCLTIFVSLDGILYFIHLEICVFHGHPYNKPVSYVKSCMMINHYILNGMVSLSSTQYHKFVVHMFCKWRI